MALDRKYLIAEDSSGELGEATEHLPLAEDMSIAKTTSDNTLIHADMQSVLDNLYMPNLSQKPTFSGIDLTNVEFFEGATQTEPNRRMRVDITYSSNNPTSEVWKLYDTDGTTILKTVTFTNTWSGFDLTSQTMATT